MLNARTLAQAPTAGDTPGSDVTDAPSPQDTPSPPGEPLRPVEAIRTKEGVIVLSNRPAGDEAAAPAADRAAPAPATLAPPPAPDRAAPTVPARPPVSVRDDPRAADVGGAGLWLLLAAIATAIATVALLLVRRKRRRVTEHYAALLAGSEPIAREPEHVGPFARRSSESVGPPSVRSRSSAVTTPSPAGRTPLPRSSMNDEQSSPQSAPPPSGISAPPVSERQWLSQRPPRSYKEPPS